MKICILIFFLMASSTTKLTRSILLTRFARFAVASLKMRLASLRFARRRSFVLFPKVDDALKNNYGTEAFNPLGLVPRAVRMIKEKYGEEVTVITDIALDPYSDQGHDGVVLDGKIVNDLTINQLCKQAVCQARAGSDVVAPSDMMDGRVGALRDALDSEGFVDVR